MTNILDTNDFSSNWHEVAELNTHAFDQLDGNASVYKCETLVEYHHNLSTYSPPYANDEVVVQNRPLIKGFLVLWPLNFLIREDLSPPLAMKLIPTDLWV